MSGFWHDSELPARLAYISYWSSRKTYARRPEPTSRPMRKNTGTPPFLNVILCSQTSNSIPAAQRTLLHADQGDQACDQAQGHPEREHAPENVCQIDAKCVCRRCGYDRDVAPAFGRNAESRQQDGAHDRYNERRGQSTE